ncbi:MAG: DUF2281 domain-containing protein [Chitinispirillales bacterium]|jgi:hypothetical protein|nr:DUF2281 domain-containing protein [Chitinispirillales bacterium]
MNKVTAASTALIREIESLPEESVAEVLDFVVFLKERKKASKPSSKISIEEAHGIFRDLKGMDTTIERDEGERI